MNARMRLLFFTNGLLLKMAHRVETWGIQCADRSHHRLAVLEQMRKDGRT